MPLPSGVVNCGYSQNRKQCEGKCVGIHWFSKINDVNINVTQICKDQGYDGKITHIGFIKSRKNPKPLCGSIAGYDVADELAFSDYWEIALGNEVSWMCEMKGR